MASSRRSRATITLIDFQSEGSNHLFQKLRAKVLQKAHQCLLNYLFRLLNNTSLCSVNEEEVMEICRLVGKYYEHVPNIIRLKSPISICGTIKGSATSLNTILHECNIIDMEKQNVNDQCDNLLFLGGFSLMNSDHLSSIPTDFSVEVVLILFCLKLLLPDKVHLLRGSTENKWELAHGSIYENCLIRFGDSSGRRIYNTISDIFLDLPLVAIVDNQVMCVNSGIPVMGGLNEIEAENRRIGLESAEKCTSMVSASCMHEPEEVDGWNLKPLAHELLFGKDITKSFFEQESLKLLICGKLLCYGAITIHDELVLMVSSVAMKGINGSIVQLQSDCKYTVTSFK